MGGPHIHALRISPDYTSDDWNTLDQKNPKDWDTAAKVLVDRIRGRFLNFAANCLESPDSGFVVLSIDCLVLETLQQFREGVIDGRGQSQRLIGESLRKPSFQPYFDDERTRSDFYADIRCGLLHQAEARKMWLLRRGEPDLLQRITEDEGYILDVVLFHCAVEESFSDYVAVLTRPSETELRANLWLKMNQICNVRAQRGALLAADDPG